MFSKIKTLKVISLGAIGPLLFYPVIFCPFRLPYLYCFICYLRCPWGRLRGFLLLGILGLNLKNRFYCSSLCPCGTIQDLQHKAKVKKFILPYWSRNIKYLILGLAISFILATRRYPPFIIDDRFFLFLIALVFMVSFFSQRSWCLILCPLGALSEIILRVRKLFKWKIKIRKRRQ